MKKYVNDDPQTRGDFTEWELCPGVCFSTHWRSWALPLHVRYENWPPWVEGGEVITERYLSVSVTIGPFSLSFGGW